MRNLQGPAWRRFDDYTRSSQDWRDFATCGRAVRAHVGAPGAAARAGNARANWSDAECLPRKPQQSLTVKAHYS
jgi:hypothetical protein